jgi:methylamine dehydrogenase heavy chain
MNDHWRPLVMLAVLAGTIPSTHAGDDPLPVERLITRPNIESSGPLVYASDGQGIVLADAVTLKFQAVLAYPSWRGQFVLPKTGNVAYVTSSYWERAARGKRTDVVEIWDVPTATQAGTPIELPPRLALRGNDPTMAALSADEKWLFVQNATPATSVSTVDLQAKKFAAEIPLPGCFGVYPASGAANRFVALCGDGTFVTVSIDGKGRASGIERSGEIFNADEDPLFTAYGRKGDLLYFVSFHGSVYEVDVSGTTAKLLERYSIVDGVEGGWRPGGDQVVTLVPEASVLYVLMRANSKEGDHREPSSEVWAVSADTNKVISRSTVSGATGMTYAPMPRPALLMNDREGKALIRYAIDPNAAYTVRVEKKLGIAASHRLEVR